MPTATVFSRGRITLPREICDELGIGPGTKLDFFQNADGETVLKPRYGDIRDLKGIVNYKGPAKTLEEIDAGIAEAIADDWSKMAEVESSADLR